MRTDEQLADLLEAAADKITAHGWARDFLVDEAGAFCVMGAIGAAQGIPTADLIRQGSWHPDIDPDAIEVMKDWLALGPIGRHEDWVELSEWNDSLDRTADEVVKALRLCAGDLRERASRGF